jgi:hypothetical protein
MSFWQGIKRTVRGKLHLPGQYAAGDQVVRCPHCRGNDFIERAGLLTTAGAAFLNLSWADKNATALVCNHCGLMQWFYVAPKRLTVSEEGEGAP